MKIAILDDYQDVFRSLDVTARLSAHEIVVFHESEKDLERLAARLHDADAVVLTQQRTPFPRALIERLPRLRLIAQTGRRTNHIDLAACTKHGIAVVAAGQGSPHAPAELTWALILASLRHLPREVDALKRGTWQTTLGTGLYQRTLGIWAYGRIGSLVAEVGRAFGMKVVCWGREASLSRASTAGFEIARSREAFFESADVLSLHLPLNEDTRGLVRAEDLSRMKSTALFVNTSRAQLIAPGALVEALGRGRPGFAAVDVYEEEPVLGGAHPLLSLPNALCTPHLGYVERGTYEAYFGAVVDGVLAFAAGTPINVVNPDALTRA